MAGGPRRNRRKSRKQNKQRPHRKLREQSRKQPRRLLPILIGLASAMVMLFVLKITSDSNTAVDIQAPTPEGAWVQIETKNPDGSLTVPKNLIDSTAKLEYKDRDLRATSDLFILTGYKPHSIMTISNKIYEISKFTESDPHVWQRKAQVIVELPAWRTHEEEWFRNMRGQPVTITSASPEEALSPDYKMTVQSVRFGPKETTYLKSDGREDVVRTLEGSLILVEPLLAMAARQWKTVVQHTASKIILTVLTSFVSVLITLWVQSRRSD